MKNTTKQWVSKAGAGALVLMMAVPAVAQSRRGDRSKSPRRESAAARSYRENDRVSVQGRVTSFSRERDGYRVQLDRGRESYWVPQSYFRNRTRDLRVGVQITLGGVYRGGSVYVDAVNWPDGYYGADRYGSRDLAGIVERIDRRSQIAEIRDDRGGAIVTVDLRDAGRRGRLDTNDLRRGDYVELSGSWNRGVFAAYSIDAIRK